MVLSDKPNDFDLDQSNPVPLDPIILRARDELLEEHADKSLEEQITFYKAVIEGEKDSLQRLSAMAARVYIIRKRLALLAGNVTENQLDELSDKQSGFDLDRSLRYLHHYPNLFDSGYDRKCVYEHQQMTQSKNQHRECDLVNWMLIMLHY